MKSASWMIFALALASTASACASSGTETDAPTESVWMESVDDKGDSLLTHRLEMTITETRVIEPGPEGFERPRMWKSVVSVTGHDDEAVYVQGQEIIFRPPTLADPDPGWVAFIRDGDSGPVGFGSELSLLVWSRPAYSDDAWTPVVFPMSESATNGRHFASFGAKNGSSEGKAWVNPTPKRRCDIVFGRGDGTSTEVYYDFNTIADLEALEGEREFRVWVVPTYNFCSWDKKHYAFDVAFTRQDGGWAPRD